MGTGPRSVIPAPSADPGRFSLVAQAIDPSTREQGNRDGDWMNGFEFTPEACSGGGLIDPCDDEAGRTKTLGARPATIAVDPFVVWHGDRCTTLDFRAESFEDRANAALLRYESALIEAEFWTGTVAAAESLPNPYLTDANLVELAPAGAELTPTMALAALEASLADCRGGSRGMIHASPRTVTVWKALDLVSVEGGTIVTTLGTVVVAGAGYDGSSPTGVVDATGATAWAYATGIVSVRRSEIVTIPDKGDFAGAVNRTTNLVEWRAERFAAAYWDGCCQYGVPIDHCGDGACTLPGS